MNWLTNFVRPKLRAIVGKKDVPDDFWRACPSCGQMLFHRDLIANLHICDACGHHLRMPSVARLSMMFDGGRYQPLHSPETKDDPLKFRDMKKYTDRLRQAREKTNMQDAVSLGAGRIGGVNAVVFVMNFEFMGGSMGQAVGEAFLTASQSAIDRKAAFIAICSSGGARMQEGILSLMQMPRTILAVEDVKQAGLPYLTILSDPTTGGVSASFAMLGDITIAEPGAIIGFAGARVIEETIREKLPDGFQRAEYLRDHGMVDIVCARRELATCVGRLLSLMMEPDLSSEDQASPILIPETGSAPKESESNKADTVKRKRML